MKEKLPALLLFLTLPALAQSPCVNGLAANQYPCNQVSLLSVLTPQQLLGTEHHEYWLNDLWGWTDPETQREYALVGLTDGVSFVEVSDPLSPVVLGKLMEPETANNRTSSPGEILHGKSSWRDIKVYQDHAFIVSDLNYAHGMQVFDLTRLRHLDGSEPVYFDADALYTEMGSAHNLVINESTGYAYIVGISSGATVCGTGGLHIVNIQDPLHPQYAGCFDEDGYTHDAQCVIYQGTDTNYQGHEICFNSNEDTFTIVDVTDKEDMTMLSRTGYDHAQYTHQGWLSEDHRFFLMNDELDEGAFGHNPRTLIWDIADLQHPVLIGDYYNNAPAIDHNLYTHHGLIFESNYQSGLRIIDTLGMSAGRLRERAFFDTYPQGDEIEYGGTWSNYPYLASGNILVSDMNNGLFILKPELETDVVTSHPQGVQVCEGAYTAFMVATEASDVTYQWQLFSGYQYEDLQDGDSYNGVNTSTLTLLSSAEGTSFRFRCRITKANGSVFYSLPASYQLSGELPVASFSFEDGTEYQFVNQSVDGESYLWNFGDGTFSQEENPGHQFDSAGLYTITLSVTNECGTVSTEKEMYIVTGLNELSSAIALYPNPAPDYFQVRSNSASLLELRDLSGKLVFDRTIQENFLYQFSTKTLHPGTYLITLRSVKEAVTRKLIVP